MTVNLICDEDTTLHLTYPFVGHREWGTLSKVSKEDAPNNLDQLLKDLNCTREYDCGRPMCTFFPNYKAFLSTYYYYLLKVDNYILYNEYLDKLIKRHLDNLEFELKFPYQLPRTDKKKFRTKKPKVKDIYIRYITNDIFTNKETYIYENHKTGDIVRSDNPDLLVTLNAKPTKVKKPRTKTNKIVTVDFSKMTIDFKKK